MLLGVAFIEGSDSQKVSPEIARNFDYNLSPADVASVRSMFSAQRVRMPAYRVATFPTEPDARRKLFEFAKSLGVEAIISNPDRESLKAVDQLANDFEINVALGSATRQESPAYWNPKVILAALEDSSSRMGVSGDIGAWTQEAVRPLEALSQLKDRLMAISLRPGAGEAAITDFLLELSRMQPPGAPDWPMKCGNCSAARPDVKPMLIMVSAESSADVSRSLESLDKAVRPAMGYRVNEISRQTPTTNPNQVPPKKERRSRPRCRERRLQRLRSRGNCWCWMCVPRAVITTRPSRTRISQSDSWGNTPVRTRPFSTIRSKI